MRLGGFWRAPPPRAPCWRCQGGYGTPSVVAPRYGRLSPGMQGRPRDSTAWGRRNGRAKPCEEASRRAAYTRPVNGLRSAQPVAPLDLVLAESADPGQRPAAIGQCQAEQDLVRARRIGHPCLDGVE